MRITIHAAASTVLAGLRDFGYTHLTKEWVEEELHRLSKGQPPTGIIGMMAEAILTDHHLQLIRGGRKHGDEG